MSNTSQHDPQKGIGWRYFLFIGILLFTMLERMVYFVSSVFEELMRRL